MASTVRAWLINFTKRKLGPINITHSILPWMVRHAARVLNRYIVRGGGPSAFYRVKGAEYDGQLAHVGEVMMFRVPSQRRRKSEARC
eukprot:4589466-Alexandrium_andersonii.AAC.1